jgi:asparagine synthetase B (glutamine-hydrolysing)
MKSTALKKKGASSSSRHLPEPQATECLKSKEQETFHEMCGIHVLVDHRRDPDDTVEVDSTLPVVPSWLVRRGPDDQRRVRWKNVVLQASVLGMRDEFTAQPVEIIHKSEANPLSYLCWNGEVYQAIRRTTTTPPTFRESVDGHVHEDAAVADRSVGSVGDPLMSDTAFIADQLRLVLGVIDGNDIIEILLPKLASVMGALVNAEFAFCFATGNWIFYGKDGWGRRSLLTGIGTKNQTWCLSSVATSADLSWDEVEPGIIFAYDIKTGSTHQQKLYGPARTTTVTTTLIENDSNDRSERLYRLLRTAVRRRIIGSQKITVLFSGGLDSVVLAALVLEECQEVTLVNVSFVAANVVEQHTQVSTDAADTRAAIASYHQLKELFPQARIHFQQRQVTWNEVQQQHPRLKNLIFPKNTVMDLNICTAVRLTTGRGIVHCMFLCFD